MKKKSLLILSLLIITTLCISFTVFASEEVSQKAEINYLDIQSKIIHSIEDSLKKWEYKDEITKDLPFEEKTKVLIDLRNELDAVKLSCSEPITIYEDIVLRTYDLGEKSNQYETRTVNSARTYNGTTTTVSSTIGYYIQEDVSVGGADCDAFCLQSSNISFSSSGFGHVSRIFAKHHQRGTSLDKNFQIVIDGNNNSSDRTDKNFSMYSSSGSANWSKSNSTYSALVKPGYTPGCVGSFYTVYFVWDLGGGGQYGNDTLERTNCFGTLPN